MVLLDKRAQDMDSSDINHEKVSGVGIVWGRGGSHWVMNTMLHANGLQDKMVLLDKRAQDMDSSDINHEKVSGVGIVWVLYRWDWGRGGSHWVMNTMLHANGLQDKMVLLDKRAQDMDSSDISHEKVSRVGLVWVLYLREGGREGGSHKMVCLNKKAEDMDRVILKIHKYMKEKWGNSSLLMVLGTFFLIHIYGYCRTMYTICDCTPTKQGTSRTGLFLGFGKSPFIFQNDLFLWPNLMWNTNLLTVFTYDDVWYH